MKLVVFLVLSVIGIACGYPFWGRVFDAMDDLRRQREATEAMRGAMERLSAESRRSSEMERDVRRARAELARLQAELERVGRGEGRV